MLEALAIANSVVNAIGNFQSGMAQADAYGQNSIIEGQNAELILKQGAIAVENMKLQQERQLASQVSGFAASGLNIRSVSALGALSQSARNMQRDIDATNFKYEVAAYNARARSAALHAQSDAATAQAQGGLLGSAIGTAGSILSGGGLF